jgi:Papain family cysteine protease
VDNRGCRFNKNTIGATVSGYVGIDNNDENVIKEAVANKGPVAVALHVTDKFMGYAGGIYSEAGCSMEIDHGVSYK